MSRSEPDWLTTARVLTPKTARQAGIALFVCFALPGLFLLWYDDAHPIQFFNGACESIEADVPMADVVEVMGASYWSSTCVDECAEVLDGEGLPLRAGCDGALCRAVFDNGSRACTVSFGRTALVAVGAGVLGPSGGSGGASSW
jgi:hypothetical protein